MGGRVPGCSRKQKCVSCGMMICVAYCIGTALKIRQRQGGMAGCPPTGLPVKLNNASDYRSNGLGLGLGLGVR